MQDLTQGSLARNLVKMAGFMLVGMVFQTLYFLVDLYFVGQLGKDAVAGVSISGNLTFFVMAATQMLGVGTTSLIAQAVGRKDHLEARRLFGQAQLLSLIAGAFFLMLALALRGRYAAALAADATTAGFAADYLGWFAPAMAMQFLVASITAALRGSGNFKPGMFIQSGTVILNTVLAPILIRGLVPGLPSGVAGAAFASFIAVLVGLCALTGYVARGERYLRLSAEDFRARPALWTRMLTIGLPAGAEFALMGAYMIIVYTLTRPFGAAAQAGFGIGYRLVQAGFMPVVALGFAVSPVAGQNFGARLGARVRATSRIAMAMAVGFALPVALVSQVASQAVMGAFSSDPHVQAVGGEYLTIIAWNFIAGGLVFVTSSMFQALGNTVPPLVTSIGRILLLAVPAFALARLPGFSLRMIWLLSVASTVCQMLANLALLRRELLRKLSGFLGTPGIETSHPPR
jgi:putative MATE family efflux protein